MTDFISIAEAQSQKKGNIRFTCVSLGDLKLGETNGKEWQKQIAVIKDNTKAMNLTLWNDDVGEIIPGKSYALESGYWTEYKDEIQLSLGKYFKLFKIETVDTIPNTSSNEPESTLSPPKTPDVMEEILQTLMDMKSLLEILAKQQVKEDLS